MAGSRWGVASIPAALTPALSHGERGLDSRFRGNDEMVPGERTRAGMTSWTEDKGLAAGTA